MATTMAVTNQLENAKYEHIEAKESRSFRAIGWGVRDREDLLAKSTTVLCQNWTTSSACEIEWVRFWIGDVDVATGAQDGEVIFTVWGLHSGMLNYVNEGTVTFDETDVGGAWEEGAYTLQLSSPIALAAGATYYLSVATNTENINLSASTTATDQSKVVASDISGNATYDWAGASDSDIAVSAEAFTTPVSYTDVSEGGAIEAETDDWQNAASCTASGGAVAGSWATGGNPDDPSGIYTVGNTAVSTGGLGAEVLIDLHDGGVVGSPYTPGVSGYPGSTFGVYPASYVEITYELSDPAGTSGLSIQYNDDDGGTAPLVGWEELWRDRDSVGATTVEIRIPVVARWLKIEEIGSSVLDEVSEFDTYVFAYHVTDGKFYIDAADPYNDLWLEEYPSDDMAYIFSLYNKSGSSSDWSDPITNRRMKD